MHKVVLKICAAILIPFTAVLLIVGGVSLAAPVNVASSEQTLIAPMTVRCTNLTEEQRKIVVERGLCKTKPGDVQPNGTPVTGGCGTSELNLWQGNPNTARVNQRLVSSQGPIIYVNDTASVSNLSLGGTVYVGWNRPAFGSVFDDTKDASTGPGNIQGG